MHSLVCVYVFYQAEHLYHPLEAGSQRLQTNKYHAATALLIPGILHTLCSFLVKTPRNVYPQLKLELKCLCKQMSENYSTWLTEKQKN